MGRDGAFGKLLEPGRIGRVKTRNRMVRTAAGVDYLDKDYFVVRERELPFYEALAKGGVGLIILGVVGTDYPLGTIIDSQVRLDDDKFIPGLREVAEVVHKHGCPIFLQIAHAGAWHAMLGDGLEPVSSSAMSRSELRRLGMDFGVAVRGLAVPEIKEIVEGFVRTAERARRAGFDGVEMNEATCHLGNSFLSRIWNKRHDEYGIGSLENRSRFTVEVIQETKRRLGQDFPVGVIFNGAEFGAQGATTPEEAQGFARLFEKAGADYLHVRSYGYGDYFDLHVPDSIFSPEPPKPLAPPLDGSRSGAGVVAPLAAGIKKVVSIPVFAVGRLDPLLGERLLQEGKADFIAMQRRLIADPELPNKVAAGRLEDIAPCTACFGCFSCLDAKKPVRCRINGATGNTWDYALDKAPKKKRVVVVGGGPAGMEAARVAAARGHEVTLYEKSKKLGGLLPLASVLKNPKIEDLEGLVRYLETQLDKLGVTVRLGSEATPSDIGRLKPDVAIIAAGGIPTVPDIPGINGRNVVSSADLHRSLKRYLRFFSPGALRSLTRLWMPIGKNVVIMGGGIHGCEMAEFLVRRGRKVTMVHTADTMYDGKWAMVQNIRMSNFLSGNGVTMMTGVRYEEITDRGLVVTNKEGKRQTIEADSIVPVSPLSPNSELFKSLQGKVPEVYLIGDSSEAGIIMDAIGGGYSIGRKI